MVYPFHDRSYCGIVEASCLVFHLQYFRCASVSVLAFESSAFGYRLSCFCRLPSGQAAACFAFGLGRCRRSGLFGAVAEEDICCQVAADFGGYAGESEDCLPGMVDYPEGAGDCEGVVWIVVGILSLLL